VQTNVSIKEECILKNKNKLCPYRKLSVFYNSCLNTFGSHSIFIYKVKGHLITSHRGPRGGVEV
jgi:hypothetical protein